MKPNRPAETEKPVVTDRPDVTPLPTEKPTEEPSPTKKPEDDNGNTGVAENEKNPGKSYRKFRLIIIRKQTGRVLWWS